MRSTHTIKGLPSRQSVWKRGWNDFKTILGSIWFWGIELVIIAAASIYATTLMGAENSDFEKAITQTYALLVAVGGVLLATYLGATGTGLVAQRDESRSSTEQLLDNKKPELSILDTPLKHDIQGRRNTTVNPGQDTPYAYLLEIMNNSDADAVDCNATVLEVVPKLWQDKTTAISSGTISHLDLIHLPTPYKSHWPGEGCSGYNVTLNPGQPRPLGIMYINEAQSGKVTLAMHAKDETRLGYVIEETALLFLLHISSSNVLPLYCVFEFDQSTPITEGDEHKIRYRGCDRPDMRSYQTTRPTEPSQIGSDSSDTL